MVHETDIVELELRSKRFSLAVRKKEAIEALEPQVVYQVRKLPHAVSSDLGMAPPLAIACKSKACLSAGTHGQECFTPPDVLGTSASLSQHMMCG